MSQLSLFLHIFIFMWVLQLVGRGVAIWIRKWMRTSKPPLWMSFSILFLVIVVVVGLFWFFCGYLVGQFEK